MGKIAIITYLGLYSNRTIHKNYVVDASNIILEEKLHKKNGFERQRILEIREKGTNRILWDGYEDNLNIINSKGDEIDVYDSDYGGYSVKKYLSTISSYEYLSNISSYELSVDIYKLILQDM